MTSLERHLISEAPTPVSPLPQESAATTQELFFHKGIIGFGDDQRYVMAPFPRAEYAPLKVLIHHQNPLLSFLIVEDAVLDPSQKIEEISELCQTFGYKRATTKGYYIVTVQGQGEALRFSINKRAPLLIDHGGRRAGQHILTNQELPLACELDDFSRQMGKRLANHG